MHKGEASQGTSWPLINVNVWNKKGATLGRDAYLFNPVTNGNPSPDCLWVMIIPGEAWREKQLEQKTTAIIPPVEVRERKATLSTKPRLGRITSSAECLFKGAFSNPSRRRGLSSSPEETRKQTHRCDRRNPDQWHKPSRHDYLTLHAA